MSQEIAEQNKNDCIRMLFINFLEELTKTRTNTLFSIYSATKLLFEVFIFVLHKLILFFRHKFMM